MTGEADPSGYRILVVEDDECLATGPARTLRGAGAEVMGPCPTEDAAREALEARRPDAAVFDNNLGLGPPFELAATLEDGGIPSSSPRGMIGRSSRRSSTGSSGCVEASASAGWLGVDPEADWP